MTYKAMFVIPLAQFHKVDLWIEGKDAVEFGKKLTSFNDDLKAKLGVFMAELESHLKVAHKAALAGGATEDLKALLKAELGAKVVSVQEPGTGPVEAPSGAAVVEKKPSWDTEVKAKEKPWERKPAPAVDLDDFFS